MSARGDRVEGRGASERPWEREPTDTLQKTGMRLALSRRNQRVAARVLGTGYEDRLINLRRSHIGRMLGCGGCLEDAFLYLMITWLLAPIVIVGFFRSHALKD